MNSFTDRERAFEAKFAADEDLQFRITARRNRLHAAILLVMASPEFLVPR